MGTLNRGVTCILVVLPLLATAQLATPEQAETIKRTPCLAEVREQAFSLRDVREVPVPIGMTRAQCDAAVAIHEAMMDANAQVRTAAADQTRTAVAQLKQDQARTAARRADQLRAPVAMSPAAMLDLAKKIEGKFPSELPQQPAVKVKIRWPGLISAIRISYDDRQQAMAIEDASLGLLDAVPAFERCAAAGQYTGHTRAGVKAQVTVRACEQLKIMVGSTLATDWVTEPVIVPMTPAVYRAVRAAPTQLELVFAIGDGAIEDVAKVEKYTTQPTLKLPFETRNSVWAVQGRLLAFRLLTPDTRGVLAEFRRLESEE